MSSLQITIFREKCQTEMWKSGTFIGLVSDIHSEISTTFLYHHACGIKGVSSLPDAAIMPAIAGSEWQIIEPLILSRYWFWRVVHDSCTRRSNAFGKAVREIQITRDRIVSGQKIKDLRDRNITPQQISYYTSQGAILWDHKADDWVLNPLWDIDSYKPTWSYSDA